MSPQKIVPKPKFERALKTAKIRIPADEISALCRRYQVRQLALFGSVLGDDFGPDSDVDFLVEFEPEAQIGFMDLSGMQLELSDLLHRPVDLAPRDGLKPIIQDTVLNSAEIIYEARITLTPSLARLPSPNGRGAGGEGHFQVSDTQKKRHAPVFAQ